MSSPPRDTARPALHSWLTPRHLLWVSIVVAVITIGLKTLAWYVTGSVGLLSDAMESFVNLASAVFALGSWLGKRMREAKPIKSGAAHV